MTNVIQKMTLRCMFIGDPHFKIDNMGQVDLFIQKIKKLIDSTQLDLIVVAGDVLHNHERLHTMVLNKAYSFLEMLRSSCLTYVLVGNHDLINNQQFLTSNHWLNGLKGKENLVIVDTAQQLVKNKIKCSFVPYVPNGRFEEALDTLDLWKDSDILFAHQEFFGCKMGAMESKDGDKWKKEYPWVISGHIHQKQFVEPNIYYSGSAMQHAFGENDKKIIPVLTIHPSCGKQNWSVEEHNLDLPVKKLIYLEADAIESFQIPKENSLDKVKLSVRGNYNEFKLIKKSKKYKDLTKAGIKIVFKPQRKEVVAKEKTLLELCGETTKFSSILESLIINENNPLLSKLYSELKF